MKNKKYELFCDLIKELDTTIELIQEYDTQLHDYHGVVLYQAESQLIKYIGSNPGVSGMDCAKYFKKTLSACSQLIKKLKNKGWIDQRRNETNKRVYNLFLTVAGEVIFENHKAFEEKCYIRTYALLDSIPEENLRTYIQIQKLLNKGFQLDVSDGRLLMLSPEEK